MMRVLFVIVVAMAMMSVTDSKRLKRVLGKMDQTNTISKKALDQTSTISMKASDMGMNSQSAFCKAGQEFEKASVPSGLEESPISVYGNTLYKEPLQKLGSEKAELFAGRKFYKKSTKNKLQSRTVKVVQVGSVLSGDLELLLEVVGGRKPRSIPFRVIRNIELSPPENPIKFDVVTDDGTTSFHFFRRRSRMKKRDDDTKFAADLAEAAVMFKNYIYLPDVYEQSRSIAYAITHHDPDPMVVASVRSWARDISRVPLYWLDRIAKDNVANSIAIDYNRLYKKTRVEGRVAEFGSAIDVLEAVFQLFGEPMGDQFAGFKSSVESIAGDKQVKAYLAQRKRCKDSNALAVLLAAAQQLVIQFEKRMQYVLFASRMNGGMVPEPLAGDPGACVEMRESETKTMREVNVKVKNAYADPSIEISKREGGAIVKVTRNLGLQANYDKLFASISYTILVGVTFHESNGPSYNIESITFNKDLNEDAFPRLDYDTRIALSTRVDRLSSLFAAALE